MPLILFTKRRLIKAEHAFGFGNYSKAFKLGKPLTNSSDNNVAFRANRLCALSLYKIKKYDNSILFFENACKLGNYRHDWYGLAMAFVFSGELKKAEKAFQNIYRTNVQPGYMYAVPVPGLLYQYLKALIKNQFTDAAITRANELKQMYIGVGKDTAKQVQRGLPSYPTFLKEVKPLFHPSNFNAWVI